MSNDHFCERFQNSSQPLFRDTGQRTLAKFFARSRQDRANRILGDTQPLRDLVIRPSFQVKQSHHGRFRVDKTFEHPLDDFPIFDPGQGIVFTNVGSFESGTVSLHMPQFFRHTATNHLVDDNAPADDSEICLERRVAPEAFEDVGIIGEQRQEYVRKKIVDVVRRKRNAAGVSRVLDHVHKQPGKTIDEFLPGPWLAFQATPQEISVDFQ